MRFTIAVVAAFAAGASQAKAFTVTKGGSKATLAYVEPAVSLRAGQQQATNLHGQGCFCSSCTGLRRATSLFSETTDTTEEVSAPNKPTEDVAEEVTVAEVEESALEEARATSNEEAHNLERPARKSISSRDRAPRGKPIEEFTVGDSVKATVKSITPYGAFLDFGSTTDGLLHISELSTEFVSDVGSVVEVGQEVEVRIKGIDEKKGQVALTMLTKEEQEQASRPRQNQRSDRSNRGGRRDDSAVLAELVKAGWDPEKFVEGQVVSTVDFGAFIRIDVSQLNEELSGEFDGLCHISALSSRRAESVASVVSVNDKVQVRVKAIADNKVSLSMVSVESEEARASSRRGGGSFDGGDDDDDVDYEVLEARKKGSLDWEADFKRVEEELMPKFSFKPVVIDKRKNKE